MRESRDAKAEPDGVIWFPTPNLRWRYPVLASPVESVLEQLWRRPDTFEEQWRPIEYVEAG
jgi:hypothetical protein